MIRFRHLGLNDRRRLTSELGRRGVFGSLFHIALYALFYFNTEVRAHDLEWTSWGMFAFVLLGGCRALAAYVLARPRFARANRLRLTVLRVAVFLMSVNWAAVSLLALNEFGITTPGVQMIATITGVAAGCLVSFSLDLPLVWGMQTMVLTPMIGFLCFMVQNPQGRVFGIGLAIYYAFHVVVAPQNSRLYWDAVRAQQFLRKQRDQLHAVLDAIPGFVMWLDHEGRYIGVNSRFAKAYGRSPQDFRGQSLGFTTDSVVLREMVAEFTRGSLHEQQLETRLSFEGEERWYLVALRKYGESESPKFLVVSLDIEDRKRAERELELAKLKSVEAARLSALGVMAGGVAHEINNPLAILIGRMEQLTMILESPASDRGLALQVIEKAKSTIMRISRIVRGLRSLSRDGSSESFQPAQMRGMVVDVLEVCASRARDRGVRMEIQEIPHEMTVICSPTQISQVILNLVQNAFDAIEFLDEKWVRIEARETGSFVELVITDSGDGIDLAARANLFVPFFTTKPVGKGTGLGLSISRAIADQHGGSLKLDESSPHTRFILSLPKRPMTKNPSNGEAAA